LRLFAYDDAVLERFPGVVGGIIEAAGVRNGPPDRQLREAFVAEQRAVIDRLGTTPLSDVPALAAWRRAFRGFGIDPTQYRSAAEALLRRLTKQGELPSIGTLVDIGNLVSIRHALPVAVIDRRAIAGGIDVRFARGDEFWADLGSSASEHPDAGEVIFADDNDDVIARRWCWRQSLASAARDDTADVVVTVEGHHEGASEAVAAALDDLAELLGRHASTGSLRRAVLSRENGVFEAA
jgi:DNA/RNA-binding domain of Phe-tRNA-synthetase-like protein